MEIYLHIQLSKQFSYRPPESQFREDLEVKDRKSKMSRGDDDDEEEDEEDAMDISETKRCYVYGQCQVGSNYHMILG